MASETNADCLGVLDLGGEWVLALKELNPERIRSHGLSSEEYLSVADHCRDTQELQGLSEYLRSLVGESPPDPHLLLALGYVENRLGKRADAVTCVEEALLLRPVDPQGLNLAGSILLKSGRTAEALDLFQEALEMGYPEAGDQPMAEVWYNLALARQKLGQLFAAQAAFGEAIEGSREEDAKGLIVKSRALMGLGQTLLELGKPAEALNSFRLSIEIMSSTGDGVMIEATKGEASALLRLGRYMEAEEVCRRALLSCIGSTPSDMGGIYTLLGRALYGLGEYGEAEEAFQGSLCLAYEANDVRAQLINLVHIANIDWSLGRFERAQQTYRHVVEIAQEHGDSLSEADGRLGLGLVAQALGSLAKASRSYHEASRLSRIAGDMRRLGTALNDLGLISMRQGDFDSAQALFTEALRASSSVGNIAGASLVESNLGELFRRTGRFPEARRELDAARDAYVKMSSRQGQALNDLRIGWLSLDEGDLEGSRERHRMALKIAEKIHDMDLEWRALFGLGKAKELAGDRPGALTLYLQAVEVVERRYEELGPPGTELLFNVGAENLYEAVIRAMVSEHRKDEALGLVERDHWREKMERLGESIPGGSPEVRGIVDRIGQNRERLIAYHEAFRRLEDGHAENAQAALAEIEQKLQDCRAERTRLVKDLERTQSGRLDQGATDALDIRGICQRIPPDTVFIEYYMTGPELIQFTLERDGVRVFRSKTTRESLEKASQELRDIIEKCEQDEAALQKLRAIAESLYQKLIAPVREVIGTKGTLGIIPHGALHQLPFAVLIRKDPTGEERYLVEDHRIFYLDVHDYVTFLSGRKEAPRDREQFVGFADPDTTLPGSREEIRKVGDIFPDAHIFVGEQATEGNAKRFAPAADILVFALHGVVDQNGPMGSYLRLAPDEKEDGRLTLAEVSRLRLDKSPLVVLSACESGVGEMVRGQGMVSLAQAFIAAGAHSVVNALWMVDDSATKEFMAAFYDSVKNAGTAEALRNAQLACISGRLRPTDGVTGVVRGAGPVEYSFDEAPNNPLPDDLRHPYFWGAFVAIGSPR